MAAIAEGEEDDDATDYLAPDPREKRYVPGPDRLDALAWLTSTCSHESLVHLVIDSLTRAQLPSHPGVDDVKKWQRGRVTNDPWTLRVAATAEELDSGELSALGTRVEDLDKGVDDSVNGFLRDTSFYSGWTHSAGGSRLSSFGNSLNPRAGRIEDSKVATLALLISKHARSTALRSTITKAIVRLMFEGLKPAPDPPYCALFCAYLHNVWTPDQQTQAGPSAWTAELKGTLAILDAAYCWALRGGRREGGRESELQQKSRLDYWLMEEVSFPVSEKWDALHLGSIVGDRGGGVLMDEQSMAYKVALEGVTLILMRGNDYPQGGGGREALEKFSYDFCFGASLAIANDEPIRLRSLFPTAMGVVTASSTRFSRSKVFAKTLVQLFIEAPYVPLEGFAWVWNLLHDQTPDLRKLGLAVLSSLLREPTLQSTETKTIAFALLLLAATNMDADRTQETLAFINKRFLTTPPEAGGRVPESTTIPFPAWIQTIAELLIISLTGNLPVASAGVPQAIASQICRLQEVGVSGAEGLSGAQLAQRLVAAKGALFGLCCTRHPGRLETLLHTVAFFAGRELSDGELQRDFRLGVVEQLHSLFHDVLRWVGPDQESELRSLLEFCLADPGLASFMPLCVAVEEKLLSFYQSLQLPNPSLDPLLDLVTTFVGREFNAPSMAIEQVIDLLIPILPFLPEPDLMYYLPAILQQGDARMARKAFTLLRRPLGRSIGAPWSAERLLTYLLELGQKSAAVMPSESRVSEALDVCIDLAKEGVVLTSDDLVNFLSAMTEEYIATNTLGAPAPPTSHLLQNGRLPRLFGRFLFLLSSQFPQLAAFIANATVGPLLDHSKNAMAPLWADQSTWVGISRTLEMAFSSVEQPALKTRIMEMLSSAPRTAVERLHREVLSAPLKDYMTEMLYPKTNSQFR